MGVTGIGKVDLFFCREKMKIGLVFLILHCITYSFSIPQFNYTTHMEMLTISASTYCNFPLLQTYNCTYCLPYVTPVQFISNEDVGVFGYVSIDKLNERIILAFRGSANIQNWIANLGFAKTAPYSRFPGAEVHDGFYASYETVASQTINTILSLVEQHPTFQVYVTGHSLGAALGILAAVDLQLTSLLDITIYNYGDPRVGNIVFSENFKKIIPHTFRVVNERDIVPHVPFEALNFYHVPREVWYWNGTYTICNDSGEDPFCSDSLLDSWSVYDHIHYMNVGLGDGSCV